MLSAGARGRPVHDGVSIQIFRRYWRREQGKKRPRKIESVFRFRFFWATEETTLKSRFSVGENRETDRKNDFRFSVHNHYCRERLPAIIAWEGTIRRDSRGGKKVLNPSLDKNARHAPRSGKGGEKPTM